ncbi:tyrosine-type recombinase/integrase [Dysgonomonas capnocytophagoides]|uniref:tyrosine-type recombinase/integrase n=1 Tax=Dysgonomonas capnocytophagoides TaxID=45254 RepID=UPI002A83D655|nr:tyrosine-type recombinase/integrase [Dysgonomonas capnocytophagoides]
MAQKKDPKTNKWYYYGAYINDDGKKVQYKKRGFAKKKDAKAAEDAFRLDIERHATSSAKMTYSNFINEYLTYYRTQIKESSYQNNKQIYRKVIAELGDLPVSNITSQRLQKYISSLDAKYTKRYVEKVYYCINKSLNYAVEKNYIAKNPLTKVHMDLRKDELKKEMLYWEPEQFDKFIKIVDNPLYFTLISFLYYMGCRKSEVFALQWEDIDLTKGTVRINKTASYKVSDKPWIITPPKTDNSIRNITMPSKLLKIMKSWKENQISYYEFNDKCYVFGFDRPFAPENLRRNLKDYIDKYNNTAAEGDEIPRIRVHDLRHSHASYLINNMSAGFTDFDIAKRLGETVQTLHSTYAHWFKSADKGIINFMDKDIADA